MDGDEDESEWVDAPSPQEVAAVAPRFTRRVLARWGVPWPPPAGWRDRLADLHAQGMEVRIIPYEPTRKEAGAAHMAERQYIRQRDAARVRAQQLAQAEASQDKMDRRIEKGMKPRTTTMPHLARHADDGRISTGYLLVRDIGTIDPDDPPSWLWPCAAGGVATQPPGG